MVSEKMFSLGHTRSAIRDLFEFGKNRAEIIGAENVYDFSLGNPSIPAPYEVDEIIDKIIEEENSISIHGYTSATGNDECKQAIANNLNKRLGTKYSKRNIVVTCGAAPALVASFKALTVDSKSEIIAIAPYFPEYKVFTEEAGAKFLVLPPDTDNFQVNVKLLRDLITPETQAVIINSPNNPSGVVYCTSTIKDIAYILNKASDKFGHPIYLISDEPYRELVYNGFKLPFIPNFYRDTIVCYSYSKSLSIPGERIGYIIIPDKVTDYQNVYYAITGALRAIGHVCAPSLMQRMITINSDILPDISIYEKNSKLIYTGLTNIGYHCAKPSGAFYLFFKAPFGLSAKEFSDFAKEKYNVLVVPGDVFGCPNYLRLSYCVNTERLIKALPLFDMMYGELKLANENIYKV